MNLRFHESEIHQWAERYESGSTEAYFIQIRPMVQEQGYLDKELLKRAVRWKSPRRAGLIEKNDDDYIRDTDISQSYQERNDNQGVAGVRR